MNFEKVDIYGFKSFADRVVIKFEDGITAIVGPNGCGKSNVADSIRFVMGESSAKQMRGGSMPDVIFNGTEKRKAQSYCEVSLYFNNANRIFNLDNDEVVLTRKLFKSGESEYLINKITCRKKDIIDAFRTIGLGKESYCVIGQGKIDSILSAKPEDRRKVFEEAAGISKFKEERNSYETKLANTNDNLTRLNDIIAELERQLGPMKTQAENAKIFVELSNRLKELEVSIYVYEYDNSSIEKNKINMTIKAIEEELALKQSELEKAVSDYEFSQKQIIELDKTIDKLRNELLDLSVSLKEQDGQIKLYNEKIKNLKDQNDRSLTQIEQYKVLNTVSNDRVEELKNNKVSVEDKISNDEKELKKLESDYKLTIEKLSLGENLAETVDAELFSAFELQGDIKSSLLKYQTEFEALKQRQIELNTQKENLEKDKSDFDNKIAVAENDIENYDNKIEKKNTERINIIDEINNLNAKIAEINNQIENKNAEFYSSKTKYNMLVDRKEYNEGFNISVKRLLAQAQDGSSIGGKVVGVVASLMKVPQKFEVAIEMALGASVQNIVTKNEEDAKSLIEYLKVNKFGRVTFLPITSMKERSLPYSVESKLNMKGVFGVADKLIEFDSKYSNVFSSLLGSTVIIDNMDNAIAFSRATGFLAKIVTLDGDIISPQGSMTGGSRKQESVNIIGLEREIDDLKKNLEVLDADINKLTQSQSEARILISKKGDELNDKVDEIHALEMEKAKLEELITSYEEQKDEIISSLADQEISFSAVLDKIDFVERQIESIIEEQKDVNAKKDIATENRKQANDDFEKLRNARDNIFQQIGEVKIKIQNDNNELANIENEMNRINLSSVENEENIKEIMLDIQRNNQEIENLNNSITEIMTATSFATSSKEIEDVRNKIEDYTEQKQEAQNMMNVADGNKMLLSGEIQRASDRKAKEENQIVKIDTELENMQNRVWEEYQMTYGDAKECAIVDFDFKAGSAECAEIKKKIQKLGNVNLSAIEEIKDLSERYNDLTTQREDLTKAGNDLQSIINDLVKTMEDQFLDCFNKIRSSFQTIFKELFGGGRADIKLEDEKNALECGIDIIAEPPGKKLQTVLALSGGEKALTAVAILFSILHLRPMPFCVLDEIEAALDDANVERYAKYLHRYSGDTQFIVITHRKPTMELADCLYGVTMEEKGVSKVVSVKLSEAIEMENLDK